MINSLKFTSGYPLDIKLDDPKTGKEHYTLKNKVVKFTDGLNVLMAPNGYGKSTILNAISIYGLTLGGWSTLDFHMANFYMQKNLDGLAESEFGFTAEVDFDGPVFYVDKVNPKHYDDNREHGGFGAGMFSSTEALIKKMYHKQRSSGQINMCEIGELLEKLIEGETEFDENDFLASREFVNDYAIEVRDNLMSHAEKTILRGGKPTIILDEPDSNLSLEHKVGLFTGILPKLAEKYQVIVSTHHSMMPFYDEYYFVEIGYPKEVLKQYVRKIVNSSK